MENSVQQIAQPIRTQIETFDHIKLAYILDHKEDFKHYFVQSDKIKLDNFKILQDYFANSSNGTIKVDYKYANGKKSGRLFAVHSCSLQNHKRIIRNTIAGDFYHDLDIVNCHPTILEKLLNDRKINHTFLSEFVNNRDRVVEELVSLNRTIQDDKDADSALFVLIKKDIITVINAGASKIKPSEWLTGFIEEMANAHTHLKNTDEYIKSKIVSQNKVGSFISYLISDVESRILLFMLDKLDLQNCSNCVLCFDGLMIPKSKYHTFDRKMIIELERAINTKFMINIKLKLKPLLPVIDIPDDYKLYSQPLPLTKENMIAEGATIRSVSQLRAYKKRVVRFMNIRHCVILNKDGFFIHEYKADQDPNIDRYNLLSASGMKLMYKCSAITNIVIENETKKALRDMNRVNFFDTWVESIDRREANVIDMDPQSWFEGKEMKKTYNLYRGPSISFKSVDDVKIPENFERHEFFKHILTRWCDNNPALYKAVLDRFASLIQKPWVKLPSCLVLKGVQRCGKGIIIQRIKDITGHQYFFQPSSIEDVFGQFNAQLAKTTFLYLDEMVYAGNHEQAGIIKKLITEKTMTINEKGIPKSEIKNIMNIVIASNEEWVVPVGLTDTRFQIINVSNQLAVMDKKEAKNIIDSITNIDLRVLAKFFYMRDIEDFEPTAIIQTDAIRFQKAQSLSMLGKFWLNILDKAEIQTVNGGGIKILSKSELKDNGLLKNTIRKDIFMSSFFNQEGLSKSKYSNTDRKIFEELKAYLDFTSVRDGAGERKYYIQFGSLEDARECWRTKMGDDEWKFDCEAEKESTVVVANNNTAAVANNNISAVANNNISAVPRNNAISLSDLISFS
jgi:Family of unknown function (DUF5906)